MNSLKTLVIVAVLVGLAYMVSQKIIMGPGSGSTPDWSGTADSLSNPPPRFEPGNIATSGSQPSLDIALGDPGMPAWGQDSPMDLSTAATVAEPAPAYGTPVASPPSAPLATSDLLGVPSVSMPAPEYNSIPAPADTFPPVPENPVRPTPTEAANTTPAESSEVRPVFREFLTECRGMLDQGNLDAIHLTLSKWRLESRLTPAETQLITELLDQVAGTVIYSTEHIMEAAYRVRPGDTIAQISRMQQVPEGLLIKINGLRDPQNLLPGQELKVVRGPFNAMVDLEHQELVLSLNKRYAGRFPISVGPDLTQLAGEYMVRSKGGGSGQPRWLDLGGELRIHGSVSPEGLSQPQPQGSVVLSPRDIEDVCDILSVDSRVTIRPIDTSETIQR